MKISLNWLKEFVDVPVDAETLAEQLSLIGLEVTAVESVHPGFEGVVVAEVETVAPHPDADKLRVCRVNAGTEEKLQIVCGAANVREGMKAALAQVGGRLPDGKTIKESRLRGVESQGMLCSAVELGLAEEADGLMDLPVDAPAGRPLDELLDLDDTVIEIELTPNRGDCLSVLGVAREVAALFSLPLKTSETSPVQPVHEDRRAGARRCAGRLRALYSAASSAGCVPMCRRRCGCRNACAVPAPGPSVRWSM
ncbi:MAG: hypothetical protein U5P41_08640 [Gammaproteobacteria bacterium]|nr:hypothetical protein [Gammaproteobacteria bacterium]